MTPKRGAIPKSVVRAKYPDAVCMQVKDEAGFLDGFRVWNPDAIQGPILLGRGGSATAAWKDAASRLNFPSLTSRRAR